MSVFTNAVGREAQNGPMSDQQLVKILGPWKRRHPRAIAIIALVDGAVLVALAVGLIVAGAGGWLRFVLLILGAVWAFYGAYRFPRAIRATQNTRD
jgi:hypothetical protein